ncbi:MAG TPA: hypothetical protein VFJ86_06290, partial [Usitatibacter sp.]|nr:hypothetical protein [Usitatibacter sp.]
MGGLIGLAFWGWRAAFVLAFLGWLAGVIIASKRAPKPSATTAPIAPMTDRDRIARLEKSLASIELRLSRLEQSSP